MRTPILRAPIRPFRTAPTFFTLAGPSRGWTGADLISGCVYFNGKTYFGFVDTAGGIRVGAYTHSTKTVAFSPAIVTIIPDIHCTPSVIVRQSDSKLVIACSPHNLTPSVHMYVAISTNAEDVSAWGAATDISATLGGTSYTYAKLVQLSGESGKMYLFYRDEQDSQTSAALCYSTSTNGGSTWTAQTVLYKNSGSHQPYWSIDSDDTSRIDFIAADGSAAAGDANASLYHFYYTGGSRYKSDGTPISASLPLAPSNATKIYDGTNGGVRAPYSAKAGPSPFATWATYDPAGSGSNEHYWYGTCSGGGTWTVNEIVDAGTPPVTGFAEGGVYLDRIDQTHVYVSRKVAGFMQIYLYQTADSGATWTNTALTSDTNGQFGDALNLRPISPRNAVSDLRALWCFGPHYVDANGYETSMAAIRGYPNPF
jgi:hypothetical protein